MIDLFLFSQNYYIAERNKWMSHDLVKRENSFFDSNYMDIYAASLFIRSGQSPKWPRDIFFQDLSTCISLIKASELISSGDALQV